LAFSILHRICLSVKEYNFNINTKQKKPIPSKYQFSTARNKLFTANSLCAAVSSLHNWRTRPRLITTVDACVMRLEANVLCLFRVVVQVELGQHEHVGVLDKLALHRQGLGIRLEVN